MIQIGWIGYLMQYLIGNMEAETKALWLRAGERFRFPHKEKVYYVQSIKPVGSIKLLVYITNSRSKCFSLNVNDKIVKVKNEKTN